MKNKNGVVEFAELVKKAAGKGLPTGNLKLARELAVISSNHKDNHSKKLQIALSHIDTFSPDRLVETLQDSDEFLRGASVRRLADYSESWITQEIIRCLTSDPSPLVRRLAAECLDGRTGDGVLEGLITGTNDMDTFVCLTALNAIEKNGQQQQLNPEVCRVLANLSQSAIDYLIRKDACRILAACAPPTHETVEILVPVFEDENVHVRIEAYKAARIILSRLPIEETQDAAELIANCLRPHMNERDLIASSELRRTLFRTGLSSIAVLEDALNNSDETVRYKAAGNLAAIRHHSAIPLLVHALRDPGVNIREITLLGLRSWNDKINGESADDWMMWWNTIKKNPDDLQKKPIPILDEYFAVE